MANEKVNAWVTFCRRTNDPKLKYIEVLLDECKIPNRRHGESMHAPILEVSKDREDEAWKLLNPIDDIPDDDPMFRDYREDEDE